MSFLTKQEIKKFIPRPLLSFYHYSLAILGALFFGYPSRKMVVVGVTGTSGKSTTVSVLAHLLESAGHRSGFAGTIGFKIGNHFKLNDRKMTMLGRFQTQRLLRQMFREGCEYAIVETTSQGIVQHRHRGIHYDLLLFTNLWPEHIEAHGNFENYKQAKLELFRYLAKLKPKVLEGMRQPRVIVANTDSEHGKDFLQFQVDRRVAFGFHPEEVPGVEIIKAEEPKHDARGGSFRIAGHDFHSPLLGEHNLQNVLAAVIVGYILGLTWEEMQEGVKTIQPIPGRLEFINEGQSFDVVVDYAFEPKAMTSLYATLAPRVKGRLIQVLGATGGGRDVSRRKVLGEMAGTHAQYVITTNEDPYDDDPYEIMDEVASGAVVAGKILDKNLFKILDRRQAIYKALSLAESGDMVLITGKGSEQAMAVEKRRLLAWDDRRVVRDELKKMLRHA
ncbi:MAG: UDP-N-acetylmuramyl-tripeptide synthetase [Anaplasmataceae bacterium]|nr:UDP-N-acetylmuramyl-tripeptide synthetase [Anaplasmataceae bacterium]